MQFKIKADKFINFTFYLIILGAFIIIYLFICGVSVLHRSSWTPEEMISSCGYHALQLHPRTVTFNSLRSNWLN